MHEFKIEIGTWFRYVPDNAYGQVIQIDNITDEITIEWLDISDTTIEMSQSLIVSEIFEFIGKLTPNEELVLKLKFASKS